MVDVNNKSLGLHRTSAAQISAGSVPVILPGLTKVMAPAVRSLADVAIDIASIALIVAVPTLFWCGVFHAVRSMFGLETSWAALSVVGMLIAGFLLIVRASLMIDRSD